MSTEDDISAREQMIDSVLSNLAECWKANPDQRLGQLILNMSRDLSGEVNTGIPWNRDDVRWWGYLTLRNGHKEGER